MRSPSKGVVLENQGRARQMTWRTHNLGALPSMLLHQQRTVKDVLHRVFCSTLFEYVIRAHALSRGQLRHRVRFHKVIMCRAASHDDVRCNARSVLSDPLQHPCPLLQRWRSVRQRRRSKNKNGVEMSRRRIAERNRLVRPENRGRQKQSKQQRTQPESLSVPSSAHPARPRRSSAAGLSRASSVSARDT